MCKKLDEAIFSRRQDISIFISPRKEFDFNILRFMPNLGRLTIWWEHLKDITPIEDIKSLNYFDIFYPTKQKVSLKPLAKHEHLKHLSIYGIGKKDVDVIYSFKKLSYIQLRYCKIDLQNMLDFENLEEIDFAACHVKNVHLFSKIGKIRKMALFSIKDLEDASFISDMEHLQYLEMNNLNRIVQMPDFKHCQNLKILHLVKLKQVTNFENIKNLQNLEVLQFHDLKIGLNDLKFLSEMPNLKIIRGSIKSKETPEFIKFANSLGISVTSYSMGDLREDMDRLL